MQNLHENLIAQPHQARDPINLLNNSGIQPFLFINQDGRKGLQGEAVFTNREKLHDLSLFIMIELRAQLTEQPGDALFNLGMQS